MEIIEQMTYLLSIRWLDALQAVKEKKANRAKQPVAGPIFISHQQKLRWSKSKSLGDPAAMYALVSQHLRGRHQQEVYADRKAALRHYIQALHGERSYDECKRI